MLKTSKIHRLNKDVIANIISFLHWEDPSDREAARFITLKLNFTDNEYSHIINYWKHFTRFEYITDLFAEEYYVNGKLHRENDMPAIIWHASDRLRYYINGKMHRENDMPAQVWPTGEKYYKNGVLHRENGPAVIFKEDPYTEEYYIDGEPVGILRDGKLHNPNYEIIKKYPKLRHLLMTKPTNIHEL